MDAKTHARKTNLDALKKAWDNQNQKGQYKFWKPIKNGKYVIRFLPSNESDGLFYKATAQHKIGDNYYFCPKVEGESCPICEKYKQLWDIGSDAAIALARDIKPRKQYLYNIIVKEELGKPYPNPNNVQVYMSGKKLYDKLMDYFFDNEYGDLTDVEGGYDFTLEKEDGDGGFPSYDKSKPKKNASPLADTEADIENILGGVKDLAKEVEYKSYDDLKQILDRFLTAEKSAAPSTKSSGDEDEKPAKLPSSTASVAGAKPVPTEEPEAEDLNEFEKELLAELK
jgi:gp32 DNA binding protein like